MDTSFFANVENIQPLIEGRRGVDLHSSVASKSDSLRLAREGLETSLNSGTDPLEAHLDYIKRIKKTLVSGHKSVTDALYDVAMAFVGEYRDDPKLLDVFIDLADRQADPRDVFVFMAENGVAQNLPRYHLAAASVFEKAGDFMNAKKHYELSVRVANAGGHKKELDLANLHSQHFQRRMARKVQNERAINGPRSPVARRLQPVIRPTNATEQRPPIASRAGPIQKQNVSRREFEIPDENAPTAPPPRSRGLGGPSIAGPAGASITGGGLFSSSASSSMGPPGQSSWKRLETQETAVENRGPAVAWTKAGTVPSRGSSVRSTQAAAPVRSFDIPEDVSLMNVSKALQQERDYEQDLSSQMADMNVSSRSLTSPPGTILRQTSPSSVMAHRPPIAPSSSRLLTAVRPQQQPFYAMQSAARQVMAESDNEDMTINSKMALEDMYDMFAPGMSTTKAMPAPLPLLPRTHLPPTRLAFETPAAGHMARTVSNTQARTGAQRLDRRFEENPHDEDDDQEGENVSPNIIQHDPNSAPRTNARSVLRRPVSSRPPLTVLENREDDTPPGFRTAGEAHKFASSSAMQCRDGPKIESFRDRVSSLPTVGRSRAPPPASESFFSEVSSAVATHSQTPAGSNSNNVHFEIYSEDKTGDRF